MPAKKQSIIKKLSNNANHLKRLALPVGFTLSVVLVGALLYNLIGNRGETSQANEVKSVLSTDELQEYTSPQNEFSINLPGFPTIDEKTHKEAGVDIPLTIYERAIANETKIYRIEVYDYGKNTFDVRSKLEEKLDAEMQRHQNATLNTSKQDSYKGLLTVDGDFTFRDGSENKNGYVRALSHGSRVYVLSLTGSEREKFQEFINSLVLK